MGAKEAPAICLADTNNVFELQHRCVCDWLCCLTISKLWQSRRFTNCCAEFIDFGRQGEESTWDNLSLCFASDSLTSFTQDIIIPALTGTFAAINYLFATAVLYHRTHEITLPG
jgi:hypothetical protein